MSSRGQTDLGVSERDLVEVPERKHCRPDRDARRNCLTSIYWVPTKESPRLPLTINRSDHVHYYQGGKPFEYTTYDPVTKEIQVQVVGPDLLNGHVLQFPVKGGVWKCGRLLGDALPTIQADYSIIAEAVAPGFDFHDFCFVPPNHLACLPEKAQQILRVYLHDVDMTMMAKNEDFDNHYD